MPAKMSPSELRHPETCFPVGTKVHIGSREANLHGEVVTRTNHKVVVRDENGKEHEFSWSSDRVWRCTCD